MAEYSTLPPRGNSENGDDRVYRTALPPKDYLALEIEAMERGMKPFGLTKAIMGLYLAKQLVPVKELPQELQAQIIAYFKSKKGTGVQPC